MTNKNEINLVDMIMIGQPTIIRNTLRVSQDAIVTTSENGFLNFHKFNAESA